MTWKCVACGKKNSDHMKWCDWCDQAERECQECGSTFKWADGGFLKLSCRGCGRVVNV